ncbi:tachylectin-related carbohydrate-binding protein [Streptomyces sp. NPDC050504]|uniref:tachylectin-related carbohydrate-binding protein n=1 Tax=Streptomyces sp. NPDC050504 TaxID=3365618 RepID=UPI0037B9036A
MTAVAAALPLLAVTHGTAQAADSAQCATNGRTYITNSAGDLYQYTMPTPLTGATLISATKIDSGWGGYGKVIAGPGGQFYGFKSDGTYYAHRTSGGVWDVKPTRINTPLTLANLGNKNLATVDRNGWLWIVDKLGQLYAYKYDETQGLLSLRVLDADWDRYNLITAGDGGVLYARAADGRLYRSRFDVTSQRWIERHKLVGAGWEGFKSISGGGGDTLLGVKADKGDAFYYRYDENTEKWVVLAKQVVAAGWDAYTNVMSAPDTCRLLSNVTPAKPALAKEQYSRTAAMQSASGHLEFAYADNIGRLRHGRSDPSDPSLVQWQDMQVNEAFTGQPQLGSQENGRVTLTGHTIAGNVLEGNRKKDAPADWETWRELGGYMPHRATLGTTPSKLLVQFALDGEGKPWYRAQATANGPYKGWIQLAGSGFDGPVTTATVRDGIQLFAKDATGKLFTALFKQDGTLTRWSGLGGPAIKGTPAVVTYPGFVLRVVATDSAGNVVTTAQSVEGMAYGAWSTVPGVTAQGAPAALIAPQSGLTEIMVRGTDGFIYNTGETLQGSGTWRTWRSRSEEVSATDPTVLSYSNADGMTWGAVFRTADNRNILLRAEYGTFSAQRGALAETPEFAHQKLTAAPEAP